MILIKKIMICLWMTFVACGVRGSGKQRKETRNVGAFSKIEVNGEFEINVKQGSIYGIVDVSGDENLLQYIKTKVDNLSLEVSTTTSISPKLPLVLAVSTDRLEKISLNGANTAELIDLNGESLEIEANGASKIKAQGMMKSVFLKSNGTANIDVKDLRTKNAKVKINGAGKALICVSEYLEIEINGAGYVGYCCNPAEIKQEIGGSGKVENICPIADK